MSVLSFATGLLSSSSHIRRVRHDVHRREVRVSRVHRLSAGFLAITFEGDALANFVSMSFDDHVKLIFQDASGNSHKRDFTPRHFDLARREITLEFALHEHGAACEWARNAIAGDSAVIAGFADYGYFLKVRQKSSGYIYEYARNIHELTHYI